MIKLETEYSGKEMIDGLFLIGSDFDVREELHKELLNHGFLSKNEYFSIVIKSNGMMWEIRDDLNIARIYLFTRDRSVPCLDIRTKDDIILLQTLRSIVLNLFKGRQFNLSLSTKWR